MKPQKTKILFKNITKYNSKNYKQFLEFHQKKYSFSNNSYTLIMTILLVYCIILNIKQKDIGLILFFIALLIGFLLLRLYLPMKRYQKTQKSLSKAKNTGFIFSFYEWYFKINKKAIYYFKLHKVFETKDYFYLYIDEDYAMLVSKTGFEIGSVDEFRNFIKRKCLLKYSKQI